MRPISEEQLKAFLEKVQSDTELQEKLKAATNADEPIIIAKEAGFMISFDDLKSAQSEISDEELEEASGGTGDRHEIEELRRSLTDWRDDEYRDWR